MKSLKATQFRIFGVHKAVALCVALLALSSCATFDNIKKGLSKLRGQHIQNAINVLGYPDRERTVAGRKIYSWHNKETGSYVTPHTNYNTGSAYNPYLGSTSFNYTTTTYSTENYNHTCTIELVVDSSERIISSQYKGNVGGCQRYANRLATIIPSTTPAPTQYTPPAPMKQKSRRVEQPPAKPLVSSEHVFCHDPQDKTIYIEWKECTNGGASVSSDEYKALKDQGLGSKVVKF
jgi:hypothetical protein